MYARPLVGTQGVATSTWIMEQSFESIGTLMESQSPSFRVFSDFDGTIVLNDVGNQFFRTYGGTRVEKVFEEYRKGSLDARSCWIEAAASVGPMTRETLETFSDGFSVDVTFPAFLDFCGKHDAPVTVLSDGLDVYVERILRKAGLTGLDVYANRASFEGGNLTITFPHRDETCDKCANCKRNHLVTLSGDDDVVVFIGDGISDRCAVRYADVVFARGSLIAYCQEQNITYHTFRSFSEVRMRLEEQLRAGTLRQRREAAMARRSLFVAG